MSTRNRSTRFAEAYKSAGGPALSFEVFPPKTPAGRRALFGHLDELAARKPAMFTCTYGAGGSTQEKTFDIVTAIAERYDLPTASHLTCVGKSAEEIDEYALRLREAGIPNIVALRGDPPKGSERFVRPEGGFAYAGDLVAFLRERHGDAFGIAVGGYPETHQEAPSPQADLENLKRKVEAGADAVITQLFYDNDVFARFRERYDAMGIRAPLIPAVLPPNSLAQLERICPMCGASIPDALRRAFESAGPDKDAQKRAGARFAAKQVSGLLRMGVGGLHFYVLNKSDLTLSVLDLAGAG